MDLPSSSKEPQLCLKRHLYDLLDMFWNHQKTLNGRVRKAIADRWRQIYKEQLAVFEHDLGELLDSLQNIACTSGLKTINTVDPQMSSSSSSFERIEEFYSLFAAISGYQGDDHDVHNRRYILLEELTRKFNRITWRLERTLKVRRKLCF